MSDFDRSRKCREWTCPQHGAENMRLDKQMLNEMTGPTPEALAEIERAFSVAALSPEEAS